MMKITNDEYYTPTDVPSISSIGNITATLVDENDIGLFVTTIVCKKYEKIVKIGIVPIFHKRRKTHFREHMVRL